MIQYTECPRDAMQGWKRIIPTAQKINYLDALLQVGFDTLDCGSFVSARAVPQMADTAEVLAGLEPSACGTKLLAIVANTRGAEAAVAHKNLHYLGYPFSVSPTFQKLNANSTLQESADRVVEIKQRCDVYGKELLIYLSMGFGNPYGDDFHGGLLIEWTKFFKDLGVSHIMLADTVGLATPLQVYDNCRQVAQRYPTMHIGAHLHTEPGGWQVKLDKAIEAGCTRIDGAVGGIGGCPMAQNELVGNMDTLQVAPYLHQKGLLPGLNIEALAAAGELAKKVFM